MSPDGEPQERSAAEEFLEPTTPIRVRRTPNFLRFMLTGGVLGLVTGFLVDTLGEQDTGYGPVSSFAFFGVGFAALGVLLGALLAVVLDRR